MRLPRDTLEIEKDVKLFRAHRQIRVEDMNAFPGKHFAISDVAFNELNQRIPPVITIETNEYTAFRGAWMRGRRERTRCQPRRAASPARVPPSPRRSLPAPQARASRRSGRAG